jgi:protein tyrosine/serine phosphatase
MTRRRKLILAGSLLALAALAGAAVYLHLTTYPKRLHAVVEGRIYRSGQPWPRQLGPVVRRLGIRTLVNFRDDECVATNSDCLHEKRFAEKHGLLFVHIPLDCPPKEESIPPLLKLLDDATKYPILMHCAEGVERAGLAAAIYRIERMGWTNQQALDELLALGVAAKLRRSKEPMKYVNWLRDYKPRYPQAKEPPG